MFEASYEAEKFLAFFNDENGLIYSLFQSGKIIVTRVKSLNVTKKNMKRFKWFINLY